MSYLIALDDGHGANTPGKRTPTFPDGTVMKENEFNRRVVTILDGELKRCGFRTVLVAPTDEDTPLAVRVNRANNAKADFYLSVHANAAGGSWGNAEGIETYAGIEANSKRAAQIIHKHLIQGTKLRNRGVKDGSWLYVIKQTNMPAVLVECGFMDNMREAALLRSEAYRRECAVELAKGLCEYFNVPYVPSGSNNDAPPVIQDDNKVYRLKTGSFSSIEEYVRGKQKLQNEYNWVLYDSFDRTFNPTDFRIVTGTFKGIAAATTYKRELEEKFGWEVYIEEVEES